MQFSVGVEYAFHSLLYLVELPPGSVVGIRPLAQLHGVSETYLSKIFTRLRKGKIVRSIPGVKGGYTLVRPADKITFWEIIEAVEGSSYMFQCAEIRRSNILNAPGASSGECPCTVKNVMIEAEEQMRNYLQGRTLGWLYRETCATFSAEKKKALKKWQKEHVHNLK